MKRQGARANLLYVMTMMMKSGARWSETKDTANGEDGETKQPRDIHKCVITSRFMHFLGRPWLKRWGTGWMCGELKYNIYQDTLIGTTWAFEEHQNRKCEIHAYTLSVLLYMLIYIIYIRARAYMCILENNHTVYTVVLGLH